MSYIIMCRVYYCLKEPDGGVTVDYETEEYDGDTYETLEDAEKALALSKRINPQCDTWISERG